MDAPTKIAVAGATGRVGRHLVDVLEERGFEVVPMARAVGVDVITGTGLEAALSGVDAIVDAATGPSPDEREATEFFTTATRNLQEAGARAGVQQVLVLSIIGTDRFGSGYGAAKLAHEQAMLAGRVPARILRAAQFHEFVAQLVDWGTQGDIAYVPDVLTQLVSARAVAEVAANLVGRDGPTYVEVAGPRVERLLDAATLLVDRRGHPLKVEGPSGPNPYSELDDERALLPGPNAVLAGPTFERWLDAQR
jgi:uncharacterized protein YbjT (DUF2867 family)